MQSKKLQCLNFPRAAPLFNMNFFKPPELGLVPLPHSLGILNPIQDLPYDLRPGGHGLYGVSQTGLLLLVTYWLLVSHWSDPQLCRNTWMLAPILLGAKPLPCLFCFFITSICGTCFFKKIERLLSSFCLSAASRHGLLSLLHTITSLCATPSLKRYFPLLFSCILF